MILRLFQGLSLILLVSCSWLGMKKKKPPEDAEVSLAPKLVGRIASIPADKQFVLIQSYEKWDIEIGTILTTRSSEERSANLRVTGESMGQFAAADIQSGTVEIGDAVYSRHVPKTTETPTKPPEATETTPAENAQ